MPKVNPKALLELAEVQAAFTVAKATGPLEAALFAWMYEFGARASRACNGSPTWICPARARGSCTSRAAARVEQPLSIGTSVIYPCDSRHAIAITRSSEFAGPIPEPEE